MAFFIVAVIVFILALIVTLGAHKNVWRFMKNKTPKPVEVEEQPTPISTQFKYGLPFDLFSTLEEGLPEKPLYTNWTLSTCRAGDMSIASNPDALRIAEPNDAILTISLVGNAVEMTEYFNLTRREIKPDRKAYSELETLQNWAMAKTQRLSRYDDWEEQYKFEEAWETVKEEAKKAIDEYNKEQSTKPVVVEDYMTMQERTNKALVKTTIVKPIKTWAAATVKEYQLKHANIDYELKII